jgi:uncharacterized protein (UPF0332 family)
MTRDLDKEKYIGYVIKAETSLKMSKIALNEKAYDASVVSAIHSGINAVDGLTTRFLSKRSSGKHTDFSSLIKAVLDPKEQSDVEKQYKALLRLKNESEYQPKLMSLKDAEDSIKSAERILNKVKAKLAEKKTHD